MTELKTNLLEKSGEYKIVQAEVDGKSYLWSHERYGHGDCLALLLETEGNRFGLYKTYEKPLKMSEDRYVISEELTDILTYETIQDPTTALPIEIPALEGTGYRVTGMGKVRIDADKRTLKFYGKSMSYDIGLDTEQIELVKSLKHEWEITVFSD